MNRTDWKLNPSIFARSFSYGSSWKWISLLLVCQPSANATSILPDLSAEATDAFLQDTPEGACQLTLEHGGQDSMSQQANNVLIAPVWNSQPWYPTLLLMLIDYPWLITSDIQVMLNQDPSMMLPQLPTWHISGRDIEVNAFQRKLQTSCSNRGELRPTDHMTHCSPSGNAGVLNRI